MVQMKGNLFWLWSWSCSCLYIPHGSDESSMRYANEVPVDDLYIPHGSDESFTDAETVCSCNSFISHMVQMKDIFGKMMQTERCVFISHMVQMKVVFV